MIKNKKYLYLYNNKAKIIKVKSKNILKLIFGLSILIQINGNKKNY